MYQACKHPETETGLGSFLISWGDRLFPEVWDKGSSGPEKENIEPGVGWEKVSQKRWHFTWVLDCCLLKWRGQGSPSRKGKDRQKHRSFRICSSTAVGTGWKDGLSTWGLHELLWRRLWISSCHTGGAMRGSKQGHNTPEAKKWNLCPRLFQKTFTHKRLPYLWEEILIISAQPGPRAAAICI